MLNRPEIPLHTNGSERDIRLHVTRRKISGGTQVTRGRDCRDAFLGLMRTATRRGFAAYVEAIASALGHADRELLEKGSDAGSLREMIDFAAQRLSQQGRSSMTTRSKAAGAGHTLQRVVLTGKQAASLLVAKCEPYQWSDEPAEPGCRSSEAGPSEQHAQSR